MAQGKALFPNIYLLLTSGLSFWIYSEPAAITLSDCLEAHINDVALFTTEAIAKTVCSPAAYISQLPLVSQKYDNFALIPDVTAFHPASSFIYSLFFSSPYFSVDSGRLLSPVLVANDIGNHKG